MLIAYTDVAGGHPKDRSIVADNTTPLEKAVSALVAVAQEDIDPTLTRITCDPQASGEVPFQIFIPDETLPYAGLARIPADGASPKRGRQSEAANQSKSPS